MPSFDYWCYFNVIIVFIMISIIKAVLTVIVFKMYYYSLHDERNFSTKHLYNIFLMLMLNFFVQYFYYGGNLYCVKIAIELCGDGSHAREDEVLSYRGFKHFL